MRRLLLTTAIAGAALVMSGCDPAPVYSPPPTPTAAPIFDSEEEALAAAETVWDDYLLAFSRMAQSGGTDFAGLEELVSEEQLKSEQAFGRKLQADGRVLVGDFGSFNFHLQQFDTAMIDPVFLQAYACIDTRGTQYRYADGHADPNDAVAPLEVLFEARTKPRFYITELRPWTGRDFCSAR